MSNEVVVTVRRMAEICQLSRSRFYELLEANVFPKPVQHPFTKRPMFDQQLQDKCLEIRRTGIGANGIPILFNRKPTKTDYKKSQAARTAKNSSNADYEWVSDAIKGLGISANAQQVHDAVTSLYPAGLVDGLDHGEVIRKTFLFLQGNRS